MDTRTQTFSFAHASGAGWEIMTSECLGHLGALPEKANIGFLYATDVVGEDLDAISARLRDATGVRHWVGTLGFGVCVPRREYFDQPAMAVMVGALPEDSFRVFPTIAKPGQPLPKAVAEWVARRHPVLGVVHADPRNGLLPALLDSISDDTESFLVGGLTASRGRQRQIAGEVTDGGISGVLFAPNIEVATGLTQGCSPIGLVREVTEARENVVMRLDDRPALDVFKEDIGEVLARNLSRVGGYIHAALPVTGVDRPDYLVRNLVGIDPRQGWIAIGDRISAGDRLMFVRRDGAAALKDLDRMLAELKGRAKSKPRAALYYSCVARGPNLFGGDSEELTRVSDAIGPDVPLVGFYANGEICHNRLYGYTGVLTLIL
jgi:small ligand-binding sensory domain FIST